MFLNKALILLADCLNFSSIHLSLFLIRLPPFSKFILIQKLSAYATDIEKLVQNNVVTLKTMQRSLFVKPLYLILSPLFINFSFLKI